MSTLTKVFVVLLVLFSIAFTSMTVSIVAQTTNWRDTALKYEENARIADTNLRHAHAAHAAQLATAHDELRSQLRRITELETAKQAALGEVAKIQSELAQALTEKTSAEAMNRGLLAQLQVAEKARGEYRKQRDELERSNIDLQRRNIDLNERVNELTARVDVLLEQRRQYEQQINILQAENEKLSSSARSARAPATFEHPAGAAMTGVQAQSPVAPRAIRGRVLEVSGDLITISVGSADGVKKDMVFVLHRRGQYVGDLKISLVDPNQSAGRMVVSNLTPAAGDEITDPQTLRRSRG